MGHQADQSLERVEILQIFLYTNFQRATMPPNRTEKRQKLAKKEGKILLAISDLKNGRIKSIREAVRIYNVSYTTLHRRLAGYTGRI